MLYQLKSSQGNFDRIEPVTFKDFSSFGKFEKDLEKLLADNILDVLFEDHGLMPIFQERQYQAEADIYALNEKGELIIFELKRGSAEESAVYQTLRYVQDAGQWTYATLQSKYQQYSGEQELLTQAHQEAFSLEYALEAKDINNKQHLVVIGSAADESLINAIAYWQKQGLSIEYLPDRIYAIGNRQYFEFFSAPYDRHRNPADIKGVLFDTNRSGDEESLWYMISNNCVAAFGDAKRFVEYLHPGDIVFLSHRWAGLIQREK